MRFVRNNCGDAGNCFYAALLLVGACSSSGTPAPTSPMSQTPAAQSGAGSAAMPGVNTPTGPIAPNPGTTMMTGVKPGTPTTPGVPNTGDVPSVPTAGPGQPVTPGQPTAGVGAPITPPPPGTASADWASMGYDTTSSYNNIGETTLTKDNAAKLDTAWTVDMGGNVYGAALQVGDKMYATGPSTVRAFDAASGKELWKVSASSTSALAYADGTLYLNTTGNNMIALAAEDGKMLWSKSNGPGADGTSSAIVAGDFVIAGASSGIVELTGGSFRGFVIALKRMTGDQAWLTYNSPDGAKGASIWGTVAVDLATNTVFGGTGNNYAAPNTDTSDAIIAYDLMTGTIKWKNQRQKDDVFPGAGPDADFGANPVLYETMVGGAMTKMVAGGQKGGNVHGLTREGKEVWTRSICTGAADGSSGIFTNFAWSGKYLIVACNAGGPANLFALDGATGDMKWMRKLDGQVWGRTAIANGVGFVGTGTKLDVFDVETGMSIKTFAAKAGTVASTITVSRGRVAWGEGLSWSSGVRGSTLNVLAIK